MPENLGNDLNPNQTTAIATQKTDSAGSGSNVGATSGSSAGSGQQSGQTGAQAGEILKDQAFDNNVAQVNREFQEKSTLKKAHDLNLPYVNIGKTPLNPDYLRLLDFEIEKKAKIIPFFKFGKKVRVAVQDIENQDTKNAINELTTKGYEVSLSLSSLSGIEAALKVAEKQNQYKKIEIVTTVAQQAIATYEKEIAGLSELSKKLDSVTAEEALNLLNVGAMKTGASDAHYEPEPDKVIVRFRIDGILHKVFELKPQTYKNLSNQMKYESKMQLNVFTIPQDGRYSFMFNEKQIGVRVSSLPTPFGESFVCRFLVGDDKVITLEELGFQGLALTKLKKATKISHGMILSTGPTGSGKSTTLFSILSVMKSPENKVITLEDPVEYPISGVTQSQIDEKRNYTFASGLRAVLRQDPDIVMLGEIRDLETAETATQAALTGHVLLSTLHTNSAIETIPRLINMGLPPFMIAPSLNTIIGQRLVRKVCPNCVTLEDLTTSEKQEFEMVLKNLKNINPGAAIDVPAKAPKIHGCDKCSQTGYKGRLVLAEVITVSSEMKQLILNNSSSVNLIAAARKEGILTMREDGFLKVAQGMTTLEEVYRVTNIVG